MKIDYQTMGRRLARIRKEKGLTQEKLAEKSNLANNYISNIENCRSIPSLETLIKLCEALDITPDDLLLGTAKEGREYLMPDIWDKIKLCTPKERRLIDGFAALLLEERKKEGI